MNTQTNSAIRELLTELCGLSESGGEYIFDKLTDNAEAFARAIIAECCPDLVIVPRDPTIEMLDAAGDAGEWGFNEGSPQKRLPEHWNTLAIYDALFLAATQPAAQEK